GEVLSMHLPPDAVDVLRSPDDFRPNARLRKFRRDLRDHGVDIALAVDAGLVEPAGDAAVFGWFEMAEGEVLEFPLELPDAEAVRERRIDFARLPGEMQALGLVE